MEDKPSLDTKWILQPSGKPPADQQNQGVSRNSLQGWIWVNRRPKGKGVTDGKFFTNKDDVQFDGGIEFRIGVIPSPENIAKAYSALFPLLTDEKAPLVAKFVDPVALAEANFANWVPERGKYREQDQRGKEICFYVTWKTSATGQASPSLTADEYKTFMLRALKALMDAGVEGIAYYPSIDADHFLGTESPYLVTYLDYTLTDSSIWEHQADYEPFGFTDPLKDIRITHEDYRNASITPQALENIKFNQEIYIRTHFYSAIRSFSEELQDLQAQPESPILLEEANIAAQRRVAESNIAKCVAQNPNFFANINVQQLFNRGHDLEKIVALSNIARFLMMEEKQIEASQNHYRNLLIEANPSMTTDRKFPQLAIDWLLEHPKSSLAIAIVGAFFIVPTIIVGLTYWLGESTRKPVDDFLTALNIAKQTNWNPNAVETAITTINKHLSEESQQIAHKIAQLESIQFNPDVANINNTSLLSTDKKTFEIEEPFDQPENLQKAEKIKENQEKTNPIISPVITIESPEPQQVSNSRSFWSEAAKTSKEDKEKIEKAEQAKKIIIEKINDYVQKHKNFMTLTYQDINFKKTVLGFSSEEIEKCFSDIDNKLIIVKTGSNYLLRWGVDRTSVDTTQPPLGGELSEKVHTDTSQSMPLTAVEKELIFVTAIIDKCLGGDFTYLDKQETPSGYCGSVSISSDHIKEILEKFPLRPQGTSPNLY